MLPPGLIPEPLSELLEQREYYSRSG